MKNHLVFQILSVLSDSDPRVSVARDIKKGKENVTFVIVYVPFSQGQLFFVINLR